MLVSDDSFAYHRFDTIAADHHVRLEAAAVLVADRGTCFILLERPDLGACVEPNARVRPDRFENRKMTVCAMDHRVRMDTEIEEATCGEKGCQYVECTVVAVALKKKNKNTTDT